MDDIITNLWYKGSMISKMNKDQRGVISDFFKDIAVGWFAALFAVPAYIVVPPLIYIQFFASMVLALGLSIYLRKTTL